MVMLAGICAKGFSDDHTVASSRFCSYRTRALLNIAKNRF